MNKVAVGGGFAEVCDNRICLLVDEYIERSGVDPVIVRKELAEVERAIAELEASRQTAPEKVTLDEKYALLVQQSNWLAAQLELYGDPPPAILRPHEEYGPPPY